MDEPEVCPKCGSKEISALGLPIGEYECLECGWRSGEELGTGAKESGKIEGKKSRTRTQLMWVYQIVKDLCDRDGYVTAETLSRATEEFYEKWRQRDHDARVKVATWESSIGRPRFEPILTRQARQHLIHLKQLGKLKVKERSGLGGRLIYVLSHKDTTKNSA